MNKQQTLSGPSAHRLKVTVNDRPAAIICDATSTSTQQIVMPTSIFIVTVVINSKAKIRKILLSREMPEKQQTRQVAAFCR